VFQSWVQQGGRGRRSISRGCFSRGILGPGSVSTQRLACGQDSKEKLPTLTPSQHSPFVNPHLDSGTSWGAVR
jgi:hypothetical protein